MAYHSFANDPGAVNYSTARVALLDERDGWTAIQQWYIDHRCIPEAGAWLFGAILDGVLPQAYAQHRKTFCFQPRTWQWIDPEKEVNAKVNALQNQLTSRSRLARESGENFDDIVDELAADQALAALKGVTLSSAPQKGTGNAPKQNTEDPAPA
jgi:capsid protein